jgi:GNAT superfamily N-acetyltransferase
MKTQKEWLQRAAKSLIIVGTASLKYREMDIYPEKEHWLGGVFVSAEYRGRGIATRLVDGALEMARTLGVKMLYL